MRTAGPARATDNAQKLALHGGTPVRTTFLPFHRPSFDEREEASLIGTLRSGWVTTGPKTKEFERVFSAFTTARHCVAVSSCTAALHLALEVAGVGPGDEVVTSPITFASTVNVIVHRGATPVFADIEPETWNIDPRAAEAALTPRTKAIIPVDFAGQPCALDALATLARTHGLVMIEDAAHAVGAEYQGRRIGSVSDITCFSFYATKNISSGEGGALTTNNAEWAERLALLSLHGISRDAWKRHGTAGYQHWDILYPGYKNNMFDLQAALLLVQIEKIDEFWRRRRALKERFDSAFAEIPEVRLPVERTGVKHAYHLYPIVLESERLTGDRDTIINAIEAENVGIGIHFRAVHLHPYYRERWGFRRGMFPHAEHYSDWTLSLPLYPAMTDQDAENVIAAVRKVIRSYRR